MYKNIIRQPGSSLERSLALSSFICVFTYTVLKFIIVKKSILQTCTIQTFQLVILSGNIVKIRGS